jgi:hypothetical protein
MRWGGGIAIAGLLGFWLCIVVSALGLERPWSIVAYAAALLAAAWIGWRSAHRRVTFFGR